VRVCLRGKNAEREGKKEGLFERENPNGLTQTDWIQNS
jgi:hypothetical protein